MQAIQFEARIQNDVIQVPAQHQIWRGRTVKVILLAEAELDTKSVPVDTSTVGPRLGIAKGKFEVPETIDAHNADVARLFLGDESV